MIRVIVIDDDPFVCVSLETILNAQDDMEVVAKGTSGPEAVALYDEHVPDVLLMDIQMAGGDGLSAAEQIIAKHAGARVVFLTTFADDDYIVRALHLGAKGYLIKQNVTSRVVSALMRKLFKRDLRNGSRNIICSSIYRTFRGNTNLF